MINKILKSNITNLWTHLNTLEITNRDSFSQFTDYAEGISNLVYTDNEECGQRLVEALQETWEWYEETCKEVPPLQKGNMTPSEASRRNDAYFEIMQDFRSNLLIKYRNILADYEVL